MPSIVLRSNDALNLNPPVGVQHITVHGSDWFWAVFAVYALSLVAVIGTTFIARQGERIFHHLFTFSLFVGTIAYFAMASDLGATVVTPTDQVTSHPGDRQIFYVKYINWFVSWPSLFLAVGLVTGVSWTTIVYNITLSWVFVIGLLLSALTPTTYKWGFFTIGLCADFVLLHSLLWTPLATTKRLENRPAHYLISGYISFFLFLYPIAYGVSDGGNKISPTGAFVFFGILDFFLVPVLELAILFMTRSWDYRKLNVYFTQYGRVATEASERERIQAEKAAEGAGAV